MTIFDANNAVHDATNRQVDKKGGKEGEHAQFSIALCMKAEEYLEKPHEYRHPDKHQYQVCEKDLCRVVYAPTART